MFNYIPEYFKGETADSEKEADAWYEDKTNRRTPDLLPRDEVARAINAEVKAGRGSPHGGVFLDICTRRSADYIRKRCRRCTTSSRNWPTWTSRRSPWRSGRPATI
jgi:succinate dehydrogenase / fumarate reductase flavoprotein subunit